MSINTTDIFSIETLDATRNTKVIHGLSEKRHALSASISSIDAGTIIYPCSPYGAGHISLGHACYEAGKKAVCVFPRNSQIYQSFTTAARTPEYLEANDPLEYSIQYARNNSGVFRMPDGFDFPEFNQTLIQIYKDGIPSDASEIWVCHGSGTSVRALCKAFPDTRIVAVDIGASRPGPYDRAEIIKSSFLLSEAIPQHQMPPFESSAHFDAKVWPYFKNYADEGAIFLNHGPSSI